MLGEGKNMNGRHNFRRLSIPLLIRLAMVPVAFGILAFRIASTPDDASQRAHAQNDPARTPPAGGGEDAQPHRKVVDHLYFVDQSSARGIDGLVTASDLIVTGTIVSAELVAQPAYVEVPYECDTPDPLDAGKECSGMYSGMVGEYTTNYEFQVEEYLKTDGTSDRGLTVRELGGVVDGEEIVVSPFPLYEPARRYLLFLRWSPTTLGVAYAEAANFGAYELEGGQVNRLPEAQAYNGGAPLLLEGITEEEAVALIRNVAGA
jgi:hypothetical protein